MPGMYLWRLSLRSDFPAPSFVTACVLSSYILAFIVSDPDKKGSANTLVFSHVSGGISETFSLCTYHKVASNLPQGCVPVSYAILLFAYLLSLPYLVALHSTLSLNSGIVTLTT